MEDIITTLLLAQRCAQVHHWKTKSFSMHLALGELYELLTEFADQLVEEGSGDFGTDFVDNIDQSKENTFDEKDVLIFITQLHEELEIMKNDLPELDWLINTYEELQSKVSRIKYKLENLQ